MQTLTKAEERIMKILWKLEKAFVKDIIDEIPEPKPPYNSVSTIVRVLEKKGVVSYKSYGGSYQYYPLITKEEYAEASLGKLVNGYFGGSFKKLVHFFSKNENLDMQEVDELMNMLKEIKESKKDK